MTDDRGDRWCPICEGAKPPDAEICLACYITRNLQVCGFCDGNHHHRDCKQLQATARRYNDA